MATNGIVLIKPSSVDKTGASSTATINAGGSVTFSACETLSLNGVFSSTYDNYIVDIRHVNTSTDNNFDARLRNAGTDATGSNYVYQYIRASATTVDAGRETVNRFILSATSNDQRDGLQIFMYGPNLAQPTAVRAVGALGLGNAEVRDFALTHSLSTAYDGITFIPAAGSVSGLIKVYGLVK